LVSIHLILFRLLLQMGNLSTFPLFLEHSTYLLWGRGWPHLHPTLRSGSSWGQPYNL
jgi:hypothetical protein